jgi:hypothetical protein
MSKQNVQSGQERPLDPAGGEADATSGVVATADAGGVAAAAINPPEPINPAEEETYWRENYIRRPYADGTLSFDHYRPAYRYGWESRVRHVGRRWTEVERDLERGWRENRGTSRLGWSHAKLAARDAWQRVDHRLMDEREQARVEVEGAQA